MKAQQECIGQRAGIDRQCISYHKMISIYSSLLSSSPNTPCQLPHRKLNGVGEKQIFSPQWPPSAFVSSLNWSLQVSYNYTRVLSATQDTVYIYMVRLRFSIYTIFWCSESCDWNKDEYDRPNALWLWHRKDHCCENMAPCFPQRSHLLLKSPTDLHRGLNCSKIRLSHMSTIRASWMLLHNHMCIQEHPWIILQSLRALYFAPVGPGSIWKNLEALVRSTEVSKYIACGFQKNSNFAHVWKLCKPVWKEEQWKIWCVFCGMK